MSIEPYMVIGDLYNRIFAVQSSHPHVQVDYVIWNRIFENIPADYVLPDLPIYEFNMPPK